MIASIKKRPFILAHSSRLAKKYSIGSVKVVQVIVKNNFLLGSPIESAGPRIGNKRELILRYFEEVKTWRVKLSSGLRSWQTQTRLPFVVRIGCSMPSGLHAGLRRLHVAL